MPNSRRVSSAPLAMRTMTEETHSRPPPDSLQKLKQTAHRPHSPRPWQVILPHLRQQANLRRCTTCKCPTRVSSRPPLRVRTGRVRSHPHAETSRIPRNTNPKPPAPIRQRLPAQLTTRATPRNSKNQKQHNTHSRKSINIRGVKRGWLEPPEGGIVCWVLRVSETIDADWWWGGVLRYARMERLAMRCGGHCQFLVITSLSRGACCGCGGF
jgi:hypothetical protein